MIWAPSLSWNATAFPEVAFGRSRWHYLLTHAKGRTLLLLDETSQLMGYLSLLEHRGWDWLVIQTLAIRWTIRRQGWARRLLEQVIREGREAGWGAVRLEVGDANEEALALYQALGFKAQQRLPDYYGRDQHAHRLVLSLIGDEERQLRGLARKHRIGGKAALQHGKAGCSG